MISTFSRMAGYLLLGVLGVSLSTVEPQGQGNFSPIRKPFSDSTLHVSVSTTESRFEAGLVEGFLEFSIDQPAYVYLLNISPEGDVVLLLPNRHTPNNFFTPGMAPQRLAEAVSLPDQEGLAFVQAIAVPQPIDLVPSDQEDFRPLGNNPNLLLKGIELAIQARGIVAGQYSLEAASYDVLPPSSSLTIFSESGNKLCGKLSIRGPAEAAGKVVSYRVSASCSSEGPSELVGQFVGPNLSLLTGVLAEKPVQVCVQLQGFELACQEVTLITTGTRDVTFSTLPPEQTDFVIGVSPLSPGIHDSVSFTVTPPASVSPIAEYVWRFGDGEAATVSPQQVSVTHAYRQEGIYPINVTVRFKSGSERTLIWPQQVAPGASAGLQVGPLAPCPFTETPQVFSQQIRVLSTASGGCVLVTTGFFSDPLPPNTPEGAVSQAFRDLFDIEPLSAGVVTLAGSYLWESLPTSAQVEARLFITLRDQNKTPLDQQIVVLERNHTDVQDTVVVPINGDLKVDLVLNVIDNPDQGTVSLQVGPFSIRSNPCPDAELVLRRGGVFTGLPFVIGGGEAVSVQLANHDCNPPLEVSNDSLSVFFNGRLVRQLDILPTTVQSGQNSDTWNWDMRDDGGDFVAQPGVYKLVLKTNQGDFPLEVRMVN